MKFVGNCLYTGVQRGTVRVKGFAPEHNAMIPAQLGLNRGFIVLTIKAPCFSERQNFPRKRAMYGDLMSSSFSLEFNRSLHIFQVVDCDNIFSPIF